MTIERSDVERISELARLKLSSEELDRMTHELQLILDHFEALGELDLSGADAAGGGALERPTLLREDHLDCDPLERSLESMAPEWRKGFFVLPRLPALDVDELDAPAPDD